MKNVMGASIAMGFAYYVTGLWIDSTVKKEIRWQQFELDTLTSPDLYNIRKTFEQEITERETLIEELESWLALPLWKRLNKSPPHNRYCDYLQKKQ